MNRPEYRPAQDRQSVDRTGVETVADGVQFAVTYRQVGWIGGSGAMYALHENPAATEPGSFAPLWREISCERLPLTLVEAVVYAFDQINGEPV